MYTLWCHARTTKEDYYFAHQIRFFEASITQIIIGWNMALVPAVRVFDDICRYADRTCDCYRGSQRPTTEKLGRARTNYFVLDPLLMAATLLCQKHQCRSFSLDDFNCTADEQRGVIFHYAEFSFFFQGVPQTSGEKSVDQQFAQEFGKEQQGCQNHQWIVKKTPFSTTFKCEIIPYTTHYTFCMGPAGKLNRETGECELCPPGTYGSSRFVSPSLPLTGEIYSPPLSDSPHSLVRDARRRGYAEWYLRSNDGAEPEEHECRVCRSDTFTEEAGRSVCHLCPAWHTYPKDWARDQQLTVGGEWLHEACPIEGRDEIQLKQIVQGMVGARFARSFNAATPLGRAICVLCICLVPLLAALCLLFLAYCLIDVGYFMLQMTKLLRPLQIQIAELVMGMQYFLSDQEKIGQQRLMENDASESTRVPSGDFSLG
ncbi:unnamed protein product [Calicophoron daubneyi]|uniref:Uncharacterized protein n=1 Tax=Calicophoron daubneyi TaxID=300641 RepID=A0AAV2TJI8_CALDB